MPRRKRKVNKEQIINSIINDAVGKGIDAIVKHHPRFKENQDYILRHIDKKRLNTKIREIYEDVGEREWSDEKKLKYIHEELTDYVATGSAFDEAGKEVILRRGLEEKAGKWWEFGARRELEGEKYLDHTIEAFQELYSLFKTGAYAERMPEVADAVTTVHEMGFLDPAIDVLKHYGIIDKRKYDVLKKSIREKTQEGVRQTVGGIEKYATYQKAAGIILFFIGISLILNSFSGITGFVIAQSIGKSVSSIIGLVLVVGGVAVFIGGGTLVDKLKKIENISIRRELLSDTHRAKEFVKKHNIKKFYDSTKDYKSNENKFYNKFYDNVDNEITNAYWKWKHRKTIPKKEFDANLDDYTNSKDYKKFRKKSLKCIHSWNKKILSGEYKPLFIESEKPSTKYKNQSMRVVVYGPDELKDRKREFFRKARKDGEVKVAHEIVNSDAIDEPEKLNKTHHIHWELENIMKDNYKID